MGPRLELRNEQKLVMTPMLQQALKVLQLPTLELSNLVRQELAENPMLEEKQPADAPEFESMTEATDQVPGFGKDAEDGPMEFDKEKWAQYFQDDEYEVPKHDRGGLNEFTEPQIAKQPTLEEHLLWQLRLVCSNEEEFRIGEMIVGNLDERGFFTMPLSDLAREAEKDEEAVAEVLTMVQSLEPQGIAARDVTESLLIQLRNLFEPHHLAETIVEKYFSALERHQWDVIAKAEKVTRQEVTAAAQVIAGLDPYPGRHQFSGNTEYVIPDLVIEKHDDQYIIIVNDETLPELRISQTYRRLLRRHSEVTAETRQYLEDKLQRAVWLIRSIEQRRKTLYRVVETIVEVQRDFFEKGVEYLKPLTLREIAERVNLHESTVSRVTSKKYAQTPRGLLELKYFFSSQIQTADGGGISSTSVKAALQEIISQENLHRPFSDQRLTALLAEKGFKIARRTVAKYREGLNLLSAGHRKRLE